MQDLPQSPEFKDGYRAGFSSGYESAKQFYVRRGDHAYTAAQQWQALREEPRGRRAVEVLTQLHPELVAALDKVAHHELGTALG